MMDARKELEAVYNLDGIIPSEINHHLNSLPPTENENLIDTTFFEDREIISQIFSDETLSYYDKEKISVSILKGDFKMSFGKPSSAENKSKHTLDKKLEKARNRLFEQRHNIAKPRFLEVVSHSSSIPKVVLKELRNEALNNIRLEQNLNYRRMSNLTLLQDRIRPISSKRPKSSGSEIQKSPVYRPKNTQLKIMQDKRWNFVILFVVYYISILLSFMI
jgi:hypothetical protein